MRAQRPSGGPWSGPPEGFLDRLSTRASGLSSTEAARRLEATRGRRLGVHGRSRFRILLAQFANPLVAILVGAAVISVPVGALEDAVVILAIIAVTGGLGFVQESVAADAVARLLALVKQRVIVLREGVPAEIAVDEVVAGDVVCLSAGSTVPGDGRLLSCSGLQVDESALTGESFPAEKRVQADPLDPEGRSTAVFLGTHVLSGTATAVIVGTGQDTELGHVSGRLEHARPPTEFDVSLQRFGTLLVQITLGLVVVIFAINVGLDRPVLAALLFSVALAVGLVPELLPAITTVTLARGARRMAAQEVLVKRLVAIEDLGAVDVLCSDKTGTLTEGRVRLHGAFGVDGAPSERALALGWVNAAFESGYANPIDAALREAHPGDRDAWTLVGEVPYDFVRKRLSVVVTARDGQRWVVTKGQLHSVLGACSRAETPGGPVTLGEVRAAVEDHHDRLSEAGVRTLGVAVRRLRDDEPLGVSLEVGLDFVGVLGFADPPRPDARAVLDALRGLGITTRIVTGDDHRVAAHVWSTLQGAPPVVLTGAEIRGLTTEALVARAPGVDVFAEVEPSQKERVVSALRRAGHVVAYLGDGINDAPALHAADVGISVDGAADVAREAADVVLKRPDLGVLAAGVREGRRTHANTLKYVFYTTSANFGNMVSMAVASLFLPFLPLLPKQILLNNFLSDLPALAIAGDAVDEDRLRLPSRLQVHDLRLFMLVFGGLSSVFDLTTFGVLMHVTGGDERLFQTGWFVESLLTELLVLLVMRSHHPLGRSRPSTLVATLTLGNSTLCIALPYTGPPRRAVRPRAPPGPGARGRAGDHRRLPGRDGAREASVLRARPTRASGGLADVSRRGGAPRAGPCAPRVSNAPTSAAPRRCSGRGRS